MLPSMPYEMVSVEPPGGSTVKTAITTKTRPSSGRTGGLAPRDTATRPVMTPAVPITAAAHSPSSTVADEKWNECHQGGPEAGWVSGGTLTDGPFTDITIMISSDRPMQAVAAQPRARPGPAGR